MGLMYADIDRQGKHKIAIRIGWHGRPDLQRAGGILTHEGELEPAFRRQSTVFFEHGTMLDEGNQTENRSIYKKYKQAALNSINRLILARGLKYSGFSPLHRWIQDEKPDLVFPDVCIRKKMDDECNREVSTNSRRVWTVQGAIAVMIALATGSLWKSHGTPGKNKESETESPRMTRRSFLKKGAAVAGLGAVGLIGINETHYVAPLWGAILSAPGELGQFREWIRKLGGPRQEKLDMVRLRNAVIAEKIARHMNYHYKDAPAEAGLMIGVGHAMIKEYLEDPELRKRTIGSYPNLEELIDEEFSAKLQHCQFNPKTGAYEMEEQTTGFH